MILGLCLFQLMVSILQERFLRFIKFASQKHEVNLEQRSNVK